MQDPLKTVQHLIQLASSSEPKEAAAAALKACALIRQHGYQVTPKGSTEAPRRSNQHPGGGGGPFEYGEPIRYAKWDQWGDWIREAQEQVRRAYEEKERSEQNERARQAAAPPPNYRNHIPHDPPFTWVHRGEWPAGHEPFSGVNREPKVTWSDPLPGDDVRRRQRPDRRRACPSCGHDKTTPIARPHGKIMCDRCRGYWDASDPSSTFVQVCASCGSTDISSESNAPFPHLKFHCRACDHKWPAMKDR